jgi:hypothetical protein
MVDTKNKVRVIQEPFLSCNDQPVKIQVGDTVSLIRTSKEYGPFIFISRQDQEILIRSPSGGKCPFNPIGIYTETEVRMLAIGLAVSAGLSIVEEDEPIVVTGIEGEKAYHFKFVKNEEELSQKIN